VHRKFSNFLSNSVKDVNPVKPGSSWILKTEKWYIPNCYKKYYKLGCSKSNV